MSKRRGDSAETAAPAIVPDEDARQPGNYPYAVTRIRARKSTLITPEQFEKLVVYDVPQVTRFIQESQYRAQVDRLAVKFKGVDLLEQALALHLSELFTEVIGFCKGRLKVMVRAYLDKYDAQNYKNILRGKATKASSDTIQQTIIAAGEKNPEYWTTLIETETFEQAVDKFDAPYGDEVREVVRRIKRENAQATPKDMLPAIEETLDRILYARLVQAAPGENGAEKLYREFIAKNIDIANLTTLFVLVGEGLDANIIFSHMLPAGDELGPELQKSLAAQKGLDAFLDALKKSDYWRHIEAADPKVLETKSIAKLESALKRHVARWCANKGKQFPLSALPVVEFILRKELEVQNLRILARGKSLGLSEAVLRELLDLRK
ncbi:MAG TPA: ATP synthase A1 subunit C [Planctomycetota bacterium]|nr:ATP synthase A1 subunit C [Planctomycetota bacterium]